MNLKYFAVERTLLEICLTWIATNVIGDVVLEPIGAAKECSMRLLYRSKKEMMLMEDM
jgi:hypothetical protein